MNVLQSSRIPRLLFIICTAWLITISIPAYAQERPTATPDVPEFVVDWSHENLFPAATRFNLSLSPPISEFLTISLVIETEDGRSETINLDLEQDISVGDPFTVIEYVYPWTAFDNDPPAFLSFVRYTWQIATLDEQVTLVPGSFYYEDPEATWVIEEDPLELVDLIILEDSIQLIRVQDGLSYLHELLALQTGTSPRFQFFLLPASYELEPCQENDEGQPVLIDPQTEEEIPCMDNMVAESVEQADYQIVTVPFRDTPAVMNELTPILVDAFYNSIWQGRDIPTWFQSGFTSFVTPASGLNQLEVARISARNNSVYMLEEMGTIDTQNRSVWEAQASTMVLYMAEQAGVGAVLELARNGGNEERFEQSYQRLIGQDIQALLPSWQNWIFRQTAANAAVVDIYGPPTPVPLPTNTASPFSPSETPTSTLTSTPLGGPSETPTPTITPSRTPTSPPASATPRPFSAVQTESAALTATAIALQPPPPPLDEGDDSIPVETAIAVLVGLGVLLIVLIVITIRRSR